MKANHSKLWLILSLLIATGCGARTPLGDLESDQPASPVGGSTSSQGGEAGGSSAGYVPAGGTVGTVGVGGSIAPGGTVSGGGSSSLLGGTRGSVPFGGSGGTVPFGGSTILGSSGGNGVSYGGTGGTIPYCTPGVTVPVCISTGTPPPFGASTGGSRGGSGGTVSFGGSVIGGRSGRGGAGGTVPFGGTTDGGSSGGTVPFGGSSFLGSSGGNGVSFGGTGGTIPYCTPGVTVPVCIGTGTAPSGGSGGTVPFGGSTMVGSSGGTAGTTCAGLDPLHEELIDNMNDGDRFIPQVNGRAGAWKDSDDGTPGSTMFPDPAGLFTMTWTGDPCRQYAAYVYGGPFVDSGAAFGFGIGSPYNASAYTGISFWAKIDGGTSSGLRVAFPDKDTQPDGGLCQPNGGGPTQCWDHYGKRIALTTTWTKYTVPFSSLSQDGWGRLGTAFDPSTLYEVQFEIPVDGKFGIWIDDVAFTGYFGPILY
jgi:hypothetical protein